MALGLSPTGIVEKGEYQLLTKADHWTRVYLSDIAHVQNGFAFKSANFDLHEGTQLIRIRDITRCKTEHRYKGSFDDQYLVQKGEILIGMDGDFTVSRWKGTRALLNQRVCRLTCYSDNFDERFFLLCLQPFLNAINAETSSVTVKHLSSHTIRSIPLPLPPLNEQHRIVAKIEELFSELDKGVESLKTARAQLKTYRQAILKHAFEGKLTVQWREENKDKLEPAEKLLERIKRERKARYQQQLDEWKAAVKDWEANGKPGKKPSKPKLPNSITPLENDDIAELPWLPNGWAWLKVGNLCDVVRGGSPRPAGDKKYYDGDIPFLKVADLTRKPGAYLDTFSYTIKEAGLQKTRLVGPHTLMISNSGATLGIPKVCLIDATFNDGIAAFLGLPENELLYHYYFWLSKTTALRGINQGAAQPNLNTGLLKDTIIPVCSLPEMQIIAELIEKSLSVCDQLSQEVENAIQRCEALRQSILKKAFSGQLVPQDRGDEPASVLLERIRAEKAAQAKAKPKMTRKRKDAA